MFSINLGRASSFVLRIINTKRGKGKEREGSSSLDPSSLHFFVGIMIENGRFFPLQD